MNKLISVIITSVSLTLMLSGCATKGRISVVDVDLRTPEQIIAYQPEAAVVYETDKPQPNLGAGIAAPIPWEFIIKLVEVVKGRVRVLSFEWKK